MENIIFYFKKYAKEITFGFLICICIALSCFSIFKKEDNVETIENTNLMANMDEEEKEEEPEQLVFHVDVKGAVEAPGVYEVNEGAIISDVITLAGGFTEDAVQDTINLSKKVSDEMVIYVYTKKEIDKSSSNTGVSTTNSSCNTSSYNIEDCVEKIESIIITGDNVGTDMDTTAENESTSKLVNINTATKSELTTLNGIGDVKAEAIIDYRNTNGNFTSIEDILNVSGIGDALFTKIKDYITV